MSPSPSPSPSLPVTVDVFSDIACPWCFIGKRRLLKAIAAVDGTQVEVRWHAYQLQPGLPPEGAEMRPFYLEKFGGERMMEQAFARVTQAGVQDGIAFDFSRMKRAPNTRLAHRAVQLSARQGLATEVIEALFRGHFQEGVDVSDRSSVLALLRREVPTLDLEAIDGLLASGAGEDEVTADQVEARRLGVQGVPFFLIGGKWAMSGAQPLEVFHTFLADAVGPR